MTDFSFVSSLGTNSGASTAAIAMIIISSIVILMHYTKLDLISLFKKFFDLIIMFFGKTINKREENYHRDLEIGKVAEKRFRYKSYNFLHELIIDLGLSTSGVTPYEFAFIVLVLNFIGTLVMCKLIFGTAFMVIVLYPITSTGVFSVLYTKANLAHDKRIENVYEAENIICNNIKGGVLPAVRDSLDVIPKEIRPEFIQFVDNVEQQNYHIKSALLELNSHLGSVADDFIKKCIVFELEEEHGQVGMFQDLVEMNNVNMEMRTEMKRQFEQVKFEFRIGAGMIFCFLAGVLFVFPDVRHFYFNNFIGKTIIAVDLLILIIEYVFLTKLRAQEL